VDEEAEDDEAGPRLLLLLLLLPYRVSPSMERWVMRGDTGERQLSWNEACSGDAAVVMASPSDEDADSGRYRRAVNDPEDRGGGGGAMGGWRAFVLISRY
jgi:hypothetical protein